MNKKPDEKRRSKRHKVVMPVTVKNATGPLHCVSMDVSKTGVGLLCKDSIQERNIQVQVDSYRFKGRVVYLREEQANLSYVETNNGKLYRAGVQFASPITDEILEKIRLFSKRMELQTGY